MNVAAIIALAGAQGVRLSSHGGRIIAKPASGLTDELRHAIRAHKPELLKVLADDYRSAIPDPDIEPSRHAPDGGRPVSDLPTARQADRRTQTIDPHARQGAASNLETIEPTEPCLACGCGQYWQLPGEPWHCRQCEPLNGELSRSATTLTLNGHVPGARRVRAHASLSSVFEQACQGLSITPEQLRQELADDPDAITSGALTAHGLRLVAETLAACLPPDNDTRHSAVIAMLRQHPEITRAFATDDKADPEYVIVTVGIRGKATCDVRIPKAKYDGMEVLRLIEEHSGGTPPRRRLT